MLLSAAWPPCFMPTNTLVGVIVAQILDDTNSGGNAGVSQAKRLPTLCFSSRGRLHRLQQVEMVNVQTDDANSHIFYTLRSNENLI